MTNTQTQSFQELSKQPIFADKKRIKIVFNVKKECFNKWSMPLPRMDNSSETANPRLRDGLKNPTGQKKTIKTIIIGRRLCITKTIKAN